MKDLDRKQLAAWREQSLRHPLVLYGAGDLGKLALYVLDNAGVAVNAFCDASTLKQGRNYRNVPILTPAELATFSRDTRVVITNNYISTVLPLLRQMGFSEVYNCASLFEGTDFTGAEIDVNCLEIQRKIEWHRRECAKHQGSRDRLVLKYIDIVITEACSMKCVDCSNLMQYYTQPKHSDQELLFNSLDRIMSVVDWIDELRVLGGEPFVNKRFPAIIEKLKAYRNFRHIVIYTNGTIAPQAPVIGTLRDERVTVNITNYGKLSRRLTECVSSLKAAGVAHLVKIPSWTDSGRIKYRERTAKQLDTQFNNCCVNDILTLLNGRLYRCPFSANATNLKAVPEDPADMVDIGGTPDLEELRGSIGRLYLRGTHLRACSYCNGRDYSTPKIEAAVQVLQPLIIPQPHGSVRGI
jgi:organic radical activating enzyme